MHNSSLLTSHFSLDFSLASLPGSFPAASRQLPGSLPAASHVSLLTRHFSLDFSLSKKDSIARHLTHHGSAERLCEIGDRGRFCC